MGKRWSRFLDRFRAFARGGCLAAFALLAALSDALAAAGDHTLSGDSKWVVIASRESLSEAIGIAQTYASDKSKVFQSENGWYAVVLGPVKSRTIDDFRARYSGPDLPSDAYLAKGSNFVSKAWPQAQSASGSGYKLSDGNKWVVIASREDLSEAIGIAQTYASESAQIFKSENGWYAVVLGPYQQSTIDDFRASYFGPELPSDAYLAKGSNFVAKAWPSTQTAAATQSEAKQQAASVATMSRTVDFGDIAFEYALPASFDYLGRDDDAVYFGEGDTVAEFAWISLNDDTLESMVDEVRSSPELYREDGYFKDGLEFSITNEEVKGNRFWADWKDAEKRYSRMTYAVVACCGYYVRFTLERPFGVAVDGWIQEFYDSFRNSSGSPVVDDGSLAQWTLPSASTPALSDAQKLYDVCSSHWNEKKYAGKMGFKAIGAYFAASKIWCSSRAGLESAGAAWAAVKEACQKAGAEDCYQFAIGDELSGWADDESDAVEYGSRAREYEERQVASRPKPAPTYSQNGGGNSGGGGSVLNDVLDIGGALLNGWNQGTAIGNALNGGGGGGYSSGGGGSSGACAQFRSNANTCRQRQMSLGGGTDPGTQAGSFYECYQMYTNAAIAAGC